MHWSTLKTGLIFVQIILYRLCVLPVISGIQAVELAFLSRRQLPKNNAAIFTALDQLFGVQIFCLFGDDMITCFLSNNS